MKVLVVGQGGREHALVRGLKLSPSVSEIHVFPGNPGMSRDALCHPWDGKDFAIIASSVRKLGINLVVIGPEVYLSVGLADFLRQQNIPVVGPNQKEAQLESSKIFAKEFMSKAGVPTAAYREVTSVADTLDKSKQFKAPYILKADGLCAGKGVFICENIGELESAAKKIFMAKELGEQRAFLEEFQPGWELSYLILTNGNSYEKLPLSQDHKRLQENDKGPNTGGMGTVAPLKISDNLEQTIAQKIVQPILQTMQRENFNYRGVLYIGMMITDHGPTVLEFNTRFGDPEAQVILPLLDGDWGQVFLHLANGKMDRLQWKPMSAVCVVLAAEDYPDAPKKGVEIKGDLFAESPSSYFLHAGTDTSGGKFVTAGGRVLNAVGIGNNLQEALSNAYNQSSKVTWPGVQIRKDIGRKLL